MRNLLTVASFITLLPLANGYAQTARTECYQQGNRMVCEHTQEQPNFSESHPLQVRTVDPTGFIKPAYTDPTNYFEQGRRQEEDNRGSRDFYGR